VRREPGERACDNGGAAWYDRSKGVRAWHGDAAAGTDAGCRRETHGDDSSDANYEKEALMDNWGSEFKRALVVILILTVLLWAAKLPAAQNLPGIGRFFRWWGGVFADQST
jgi:hypothetical protein